MKLISDRPGMLQLQFGMEIVQLAWTAEQEAPHDSLCVWATLSEDP